MRLPPWLRRNRDRDLDDEIRAHLRFAVADRVARGEAAEDAEHAARREFGNVTRVKELTRESWGWTVVDRWLRDLRYAARSLRQQPAFSGAALVCLAAGVGVSTTIFGAVNGILLRPLPYAADRELVVIRARSAAAGAEGAPVSGAEIAAWLAGSRTLSALGVWRSRFDELSGPEGTPERVESAVVSASLFPILGATPVAGRSFQPEDERPSSPRVVLLSHGLWERRYGRDPSVVGRNVQVFGEPHLVLGVMPRGFSFPEGTQLWLPNAVDPARTRVEERVFTAALGRLRPGSAAADAERELSEIMRRREREAPAAGSMASAGWEADVASLRDALAGNLRRPVLILQGAALLVLLVACANVANLMLARAAGRHRELAIRVAIGARRRDLIIQLLWESVLLALAGGVAGAALAVYGVRLLALAFPDGVPSYFVLNVDMRVLAFTLCIALGTAALSGLAPALRSTRVPPGSVLREGVLGARATRRTRGTHGTLVALEVALSAVLVIAATLFLRSALVLEHELGFDPRRTLSVRVALPGPRYDGRAREAFYHRLFERVRALPGIEAVGSTAAAVPLGARRYARRHIELDGRPRPSDGSEPTAVALEVSREYLQVLRVPVVRGRSFAAVDVDSSVGSAIVNEAFARQYFGDQSAVGQRVRVVDGEPAGPWLTIVGVTRNFREEQPPQPIAPAIYFPRRSDPASQTLVIRTRLEDPLALVPDIRTVVASMDPTLAPYLVQTLEQAVTRGLWRERLQARVLGVFASLALLLALFGIYGVVSYAVAQRSRELGIRLALGATRAHVLSLVLGEGARLALLGLVLAVPAALALTRLVGGLLYEVSPTDPMTFIAVPIALGGLAVLAGIAPARRAAKVDPLVAMRTD